MFENEAEFYAREKYSPKTDSFIVAVADDAFKDGAEFGYNKAFVEADKNLKAVIADFNKANEWHYVKDGDLPKEDLRPRTLGYYLTASKHISYKGFVFEVAYFTGVIFIKGGDILDNVVAWKEIVPPDIEPLGRACATCKSKNTCAAFLPFGRCTLGYKEE